MRRIAVFLLTALSVCAAKDCTDYKAAKIVGADQSVARSSVQNTYDGTITPISWYVMRMKVQFSDMAYTVEYTRGPKASAWIVGDPVEACLNSKNVYVKLPNEKPTKMRIITRERIAKTP